MKAIIFIALAMFVPTLTPAFAGDSLPKKHWNAYAKAGVFSWEETHNGKRFIKDSGMMYAAGITRTDRVYGPLFLSETVELWGGNPTYDGSRMFTGEPVYAPTWYVGTREEIRASIGVPIMKNLSFDPFIGIGHKFWFRTLEGEVWNTIALPTGMRATYRLSDSLSTFAEGGVTLPLLTKNRGYLANSGIGFGNITTEPKAKVGQIAEIGVSFRSFSFSFSYEATTFGRSNMVTSGSLNGKTSASFFQPDSRTSTSWLKIGHNF